MKITYLHNPKCSKSREGLSLLTTYGVEVHVILYLESFIDDSLLDVILKNLPDRKFLIRTKETEYDNFDIHDTEVVRKKLKMHPILLERPIAIREDGKMRIGRPPEKILELLTQK